MPEKSCVADAACPNKVLARGMCRKHYQRWWKTGSTEDPKRLTPIERFMEKVDLNGPVPEHRPELGPCHEWTGHLAAGGYGWFWDGTKYPNGRNRMVLAHRWIFIQRHGAIDEKQKVCHHCDNRRCTRDGHHFLGTQRDNMQDRNDKQRHSHGVRHPDAKFTDEQVLEIRRAAKTQSFRSLASQYGVAKTTISRMVQGKNWKHLPLDPDQSRS
jgi:hypothetical protein